MPEKPSAGAPAAQRQRVIAALVYSGTAVVCLLLFAGLAVRRGWLTPFARAPMRLEGDWMMQPDPEIGYVPTPNAATVWRNTRSPGRFHVYTDRRGARVNAPGEQTPARVDFLTVGCSFSWGYLMENEESYTERLARRLGRQCSGR
jgi:hypothetical protein